MKRIILLAFIFILTAGLDVTPEPKKEIRPSDNIRLTENIMKERETDRKLSLAEQKLRLALID